MRRDFFCDFDLAGGGICDLLVQVLVLYIEFRGVLNLRVGVGLMRRRRHGGRARGFCLIASFVLPPRPGESGCVSAVSELFTGRVLRLPCYLCFVGSIAFVGYSKEGSCRRHLKLGEPGYSLWKAEILGVDARLAATCSERSRLVSSRGLEHKIRTPLMLCFTIRCSFTSRHVDS
jgi:hypothetical protein